MKAPFALPPRDLEPWSTISVLGPHSFHVSWGVGFMRNDFASRFTVRGAERLRDRKLAAMRRRAAKIAAAESRLETTR